MVVDIKILRNYFCEYKISSFSLYIKPYGITFHNKIPRKDIFGNEQFNDKKEFTTMLNNFISNIKNKKDDLSHWLNKFCFKKIYVKKHIKIILHVYENICFEINKRDNYLYIYRIFNADKENNFLVEARFEDWTKISRVYFLFQFLPLYGVCILHPLFIDASHICCNTEKDYRVKEFLENSSNFFD